ncbi:pyruvate dehydrogenase complex dihydrolipoyllysine-residue acetyltransferase [Salinibius halmophilus]|uniref:pyruvate dehydrogenase complex dihydrolipoyllysine-residue acetyltransferase n=1 Tax=Salinibius halmophilus TaxID=1853216 RepID=UPI000E65EF6C|nr:pyruvate dehydrogenase complex dihydrolipoyllysine-residue acetyltransferase [Salinibius halmophilus]
MATEIIRVPDIGTSDKVTIIEVSVSAGDTVAEDDTLIVLESDKASMDIPAPKAGKITSIKVAEGDEIGEGDEIAYIEVEGAASEEAAPAAEAPAAAEPAASASEVVEVKVPNIDSEDDVEIIEINVAVGDTIAEDDTVVTLESDKASMEIPSTAAGEVVSLKVKEGDKVNEGALLIEVRTAGGAAPAAAEAPKAAAPAAGGVETIEVPDIDGAEGVEVIEVSIAVGDEVAEEDTLITLESDKASMEIPAPKGGKVVKLHVAEGDKVSQGDKIADIEVAGGTVEVAAPAAEKPAAPAPAAPAAVEKPQAATYATDDEELTRPSKIVHAGPAVRMLAREFGVDLAFVTPTGPRGRILKEDVANWVKQKLKEPKQVSGGAGLPEIPDQDFSKFGEVSVEKMSRIQQLTAQNMVRNWLNIPHVTLNEEADITELEAFRKSLKAEAEKRGSKLSSLAFVVKAAASALEAFPQFNVSLLANGTEFVQKHYINIGIAVDTPNGLVVPVIKDADKKSVWQIADEIIDVATRGRKGQLKAADMQGGCFTISSLGGLGSTSFTPIVNAPEVAILGLSNNQIKPLWNGKEFEPRTVLPMSLSFDHRAINGADGARFATFIKNALTDLRRLVL